MRRLRASRLTNWFAAVAYALAIVASSVSHVHFHALADSATECVTRLAHHHGDCDHEHDSEHDSDHPLAGHEGTSTGHEAPTGHDDDCNICRFLSRPVLQVTPFEIDESRERVAPVAAVSLPEIRPTVLCVAQARAPPTAAV